MTETSAKVSTNTDRGLVYFVKPYKRTWLPMDNDGAYVFSKAVKSFVAHRQGSRLLTGLTEEQATQLEKELKLKPETLTPYNKEFWGNFRISVGQEGLVLDTNDPSDYIKYKVLLAGPFAITPDEEGTAKALTAEVIVTSVEKQARAKNKLYEIKDEASAKKRNMSLEDMRDFLVVYNEGKLRLSKDHKDEWIRSEVGRIADEDSAKFNTVLEDPYYKGKILVNQAISVGAMTRLGPKYFMTGEMDPIGTNIAEAIDYLYDPTNQSILLAIKSKIELTK
jgi:hypothetical protein